jgi:hypothetical protein
MILEFRTERDRNGNALYLAIDTEAKIYSTNCKTWISTDFPILRRNDRKMLIALLEMEGFTQKYHI